MQSAEELNKAALDRIEEAFRSLERAPAMWGSPDAQEGQAYILVGLRQLLYGYENFDLHRVYFADFQKWVAQMWPPLKEGDEPRPYPSTVR
jgi:hypothetical protein